MVNTVKFSQFATAPLTNSDNEVIGLENGANVQSVRFLTWTTAGRPAHPFNGLLGLNTDFQQYEFWDSTLSEWVQFTDTSILPLLASHLPGEGASLIGLQDQSNVTSKTVQDLANAQFIVQVNNGSLQNAQSLGSLTTGIVKNATGTGVLSISAPLTSIDSLTTVANQFLVTTAPNVYATLGPMTNGQLIIGSTGAAPALATIIQGSGVTITNGPGTITISATGTGGTVTSLTAATGIVLTPSTITTTGTIGLVIPVAISSGGTGLTALGTGVQAALGQNVTGSGGIVLQESPTILDTNGNPMLEFITAPSAVNFLTLANGSTGGPPTLFATGTDTNIDLFFITKGTGRLVFDSSNTTTPIQFNTGTARQHTTDFSFADTANSVVVTFQDSSGTVAYTSQLPTPAALTEVNDTNVTLTLGGSPTTALLQAVSLTLGWTGTLSPTRGGLGLANPTAHGILVGEGSSAVNPITLSSGQILIGVTGSDPVAAAISSGTGILVGNGPGSITVSLAAIASNNILANITGGSAAPIPNTLTAIIDSAIGNTQGDILYRNATSWVVLAPSTSGFFLQTQGAAANPQWAAAPGASPAALTKTDDTNVTLTLGGSPSTALLAATSLTLGWTGQLSLARGGTNANLTASNGGIFYSTASAGAILSGTATANQILLSGSTAAPAWSTATYPANTTINQLLYSSAANTITGLATVNSAVLVTSAGGVPSLSTTLPNGLAMGTPASITLTNGTGLPIGGLTGLGTGVATALAANVTGSGGIVLATSPTLVTPTLGVASATSINFGGGALKTYKPEASFTPTITFATPGDLTVSYSTQSAVYTEIGNLVFVQVFLGFTPTYTTASGAVRISGLPQTATDSYFSMPISFVQSFIFPVGTTMMAVTSQSGQSFATLTASGSGVAAASVSTTQLTSGGNYFIVFSGFYSNTSL